MRLYAQLRFYLMQLDLAKVRSQGRADVREWKSCLEITEGYWHSLSNKLQGYRFDSVRDEIYFFKRIKPRFSGEMTFYRLLLDLEQFRLRGTGDFEAHLEVEVLRLENFINEHPHFYQ